MFGYNPEVYYSTYDCDAGARFHAETEYNRALARKDGERKDGERPSGQEEVDKDE